MLSRRIWSVLSFKIFSIAGTTSGWSPPISPSVEATWNDRSYRQPRTGQDLQQQRDGRIDHRRPGHRIRAEGKTRPDHSRQRHGGRIADPFFRIVQQFRQHVRHGLQPHVAQGHRHALHRTRSSLSSAYLASKGRTGSPHTAMICATSFQQALSSSQRTAAISA